MERDPSGQLAWLVTELEAAERAGERVWLMGERFAFTLNFQCRREIGGPNVLLDLSH